jgi:L-lactate utilization protein LutB
MLPEEKERNRKVAQKVIAGLRSRNMEGYFVETKEEALGLALDLIPQGSSVSWGGTHSVEEIGLKDVLVHGHYTVFNPFTKKTPEEKREMMLKAHSCDTFLSSTNAITEDGILVNMDGNSNRVSCIAYGPKTVLMIVGMNKVRKNLEDAILRTRNVAAPINAQYFPHIKTPCKVNGACADCKSPDTLCCNLLITRYSREKGRIKVILVNENLGF